MKRICSCIFLLIIPAAPLLGQKVNDVNTPDLRPGAESKFTFEGDELVIFIPNDYNDSNALPVIFYYHGQGGKPDVGFFRYVTDSNGFIIIGMSYTYEPKPPASAARYANYLKTEMRRVGKLILYLQRDLGVKIDNNKLIVSGISKGGWFTSEAIEYRPQPWAGAIIIAAGRVRTTDYPGVKKLKDKLIYIGVGETDPNRKSGELANGFYRRYGAIVTFEIYEGLGHAPNPHSQILKQWLKDLAAK
ncbi:MAG: hypothetical protein WC374_08665 [Phycisphaerae bacterium]|jgi:predicted esterase